MDNSQQNHWRFGIDRGGTFTDIIGLAPNGQLHTVKVLSESDAYKDSGIEGIRRILGLSADSPLPEERIAWIRMGTTVATNALLERKGAKTGLLITKGFRDLLEIGTQERPDLFALAIQKPAPLYSTVVEIPERIGPDGKVLDPLNASELQRALTELKTQNVESLAIVFLHAWKNPEHENMAAHAAETMGFTHISTSSNTMPLIQVVGRGRTTLIDAYLSPVLTRYMNRIKNWIGNIPIYFMSSSGDLMAPNSFSGKDAVLSGPAGGVLGVAELAEQEKDTAVLGFDMGGTSTDVCRYGGQLERILEVETAGVKFTSPMLHVETVAAGGGSIVAFDGHKLTVGPESAGADPGPACYGRGGPATITDVNLILGRIQPEYFPQVFGPTHNNPLDVTAAHTRLKVIAAQVDQALGKNMSIETLALGFIRIANEAMSRPIKELSVARGHDPRNHTLLCFGGAGAQHACGIARSLAIKTVRIPPMASLLSAYGILRTSARRNRITSQLHPLNHSTLEIINQQAQLIATELESQLRGEHHLPTQIKVQRRLDIDLRTPGTDSPITLPLISNLQTLKQDFDHAHRHLYGFSPQTITPEIVNLRVDVFAQREQLPKQPSPGEQTVTPTSKVDVWFEKKGAINTPVHHWQTLMVNEIINGPALIIDQHSTVVVEPGFSTKMNQHGVLTLTLKQEQ
ncbi:MAG: 5-oxoprolinase, partial [Gammaproteobacteria bacterium]|nr:5-oxoprolinase [Gammaproteobacteria bacterium]